MAKEVIKLNDLGQESDCWKNEQVRRMDAQAKKEVEDLVSAFKAYNLERQKKEKEENLAKKIESCDWKDTKQLLKLLNRAVKIIQENSGWDAAIHTALRNLLNNLLNNAESIDKEVMKKFLKINLIDFCIFNNDEDSPLIDDRLREALDKCDMDDDLIYNCIMAWHYNFLESLVDEDRLKKINKKAYDDFKKYLFSGELRNKNDLVNYWPGHRYRDTGRTRVERELFDMFDNWDFDYEVFDFLMKHDAFFEKEFHEYARYFTGMSDEEFKNTFGYARKK